ncbi:hypothetical protein EDB85DRAFT_1908977 [Lactarius pseudohatsudake]|nr:hypothetical protein EDB85DRAFT_1908977 [Lactarius pseudohatsudake]
MGPKMGPPRRHEAITRLMVTPQTENGNLTRVVLVARPYTQQWSRCFRNLKVLILTLPRPAQKQMDGKKRSMKSPPSGLDVRPKSARSQRRPVHQRAIKSQSRLTSFAFTRSAGPSNTSSTQSPSILLPKSSPCPDASILTTGRSSPPGAHGIVCSGIT